MYIWLLFILAGILSVGVTAAITGSIWHALGTLVLFVVGGLAGIRSEAQRED